MIIGYANAYVTLDNSIPHLLIECDIESPRNTCVSERRRYGRRKQCRECQASPPVHN